MAKFTTTDDPRFVADENGRYVPIASVDRNDVQVAPPKYDTTATPTAADAAGKAPTYNHDALDEIEGKLAIINGGLLKLAQSDKQFSTAGVQTARAMNDAETGNLSAQALSSAAGTVGGVAGLRAKAAQNAAGQGALERSKEEDANSRFKLAAFDAAGKLGLNTAAMEVNVQKLNVGAATNYLNDLFQQKGIEMKLNEAQAERMLQGIKDMAILQADYYAMDAKAQSDMLDRVVRKYGIDKGVGDRMAQIASSGTTWGDVLLGAANTGLQAAGRSAFSSKPENQATDTAAGKGYNQASNQRFTTTQGNPYTPTGIGGNY